MMKLMSVLGVRRFQACMAFFRDGVEVRRLSVSLLAVVAIFAVSCESLPPGEPPEGPIIPEPELKIPKLDGPAAVNRFLTAIAMRCDPIAGAGKTPPLVSNMFVVSKERVNYLPLEVWRKLINMKLIRPATEGGTAAAYRLESEITRMNLGASSNSKTYAWEMKLRNLKTGKIAWSKVIKFTEEK